MTSGPGDGVRGRVDDVGVAVVRELVEEKRAKVLAALPDGGEGWTTHLICFARSGFTLAAQTFASETEVKLIDLQKVDNDLCAAL